MSRLTTLSPAAIKAFFSPDSDEQIITLLTFITPGEILRIADGYTQRISETDDEVLYGVVSRGESFTFLPFSLSLPGEDAEQAPACQITMHDVTRRVMPIIRDLTSPPAVTMELVLASTPDVVEVAFPNFQMNGIAYDTEQITASLNVDMLALEPFPAHSFVPSAFPGIF